MELNGYSFFAFESFLIFKIELKETVYRSLSYVYPFDPFEFLHLYPTLSLLQ